MLNATQNVQNNTIEQYQTFFNHICGSSTTDYTPPKEIIDYCKNSNIHDFRNLIRNLSPEIENLRTTTNPPRPTHKKKPTQA